MGNILSVHELEGKNVRWKSLFAVLKFEFFPFAQTF